MITLDSLVPQSLPYPIRGGIIRGVRTGIAFLLAGLAASLADGSLVHEFKFIPSDYVPFVTLGLTTAFTGIDKWLREKGLVDQAAEDNAHIPLSGDEEDHPTPPSVVDVPPPVVNVGTDTPPDTDVPTTDSGETGGSDPVAPDDPVVFDDPNDSV